jgi:hypothetical protein
MEPRPKMVMMMIIIIIMGYECIWVTVEEVSGREEGEKG